MLCQLLSRARSQMCATGSSPYIAASSIRCMKTALRAKNLIRNPPVLLATLLVNITRMVIVQFMMRLCVWRKISQCACRFWMGRGTLAPLTAIRLLRCAIPKSVWTALRLSSWRILKKIRSISKKTMTPQRQSRLFCLHAFQISSSMARAALLWVWQRISPRITLAKSWMPPLLFLKMVS